jgi:hypothetical protein
MSTKLSEERKPEAVWQCRIGVATRAELPPGSDAPLRDAVEEAFRNLLGREPLATFSGWGEKFTESEWACIENREPRYEESELASLRAVLGQAREALSAYVDHDSTGHVPREYEPRMLKQARAALAALDERDGECARLREFAADFAALEQTNADILRERDAARVEVAKLTLATTNLRGIVSDQEEDLASLRDNLAASQAREARLVSALEAIRDRKPNVCAGFELCDHIGCQASYEAWADADTALSAPASDALGAIRRAQDALLHATNFSERLDALGALDRIFGEVSSS